MKIAVIGNGSIGRRHLRGLSKLKDNLGIKELRSFDTNPERVKQVPQETPNVLTASSVKEAPQVPTQFLCACPLHCTFLFIKKSNPWVILTSLSKNLYHTQSLDVSK